MSKILEEFILQMLKLGCRDRKLLPQLHKVEKWLNVCVLEGSSIIKQ